LILKERERRDLGRWEDMRDCFHADSQIRISWFRGNGADFVKGSIDMARCNVLAKRRLSPIRVVLAGRARRRHHVGRHRDSRRAQGSCDESAELHALRLSGRAARGDVFSASTRSICATDSRPPFRAIRSPSIRMSCGRFGRHTGSSLMS
jgi:hypothetical protein